MTKQRRARVISFSVTVEERAVIEDYCRRKRNWRTPSDLARDAVWQHMLRYPAYESKRPTIGPKKEGDR